MKNYSFKRDSSNKIDLRKALLSKNNMDPLFRSVESAKTVMAYLNKFILLVPGHNQNNMASFMTNLQTIARVNEVNITVGVDDIPSLKASLRSNIIMLEEALQTERSPHLQAIAGFDWRGLLDITEMPINIDFTPSTPPNINVSESSSTGSLDSGMEIMFSSR